MYSSHVWAGPAYNNTNTDQITHALTCKSASCNKDQTPVTHTDQAQDTRNILNDLMTADQIAQAQCITRTFFEDAAKLVPNTSQTVTRESE